MEKNIKYFIKHVHLTENNDEFSENSSFKEWMDTFLRYKEHQKFSRENLPFFSKYHSTSQTDNIKDTVEEYLRHKYNISSHTWSALISYICDTQTVHFLPTENFGYSLIEMLFLYHENDISKYTFNINNPQLHNPEIVAYIYRKLLNNTSFVSNEEYIARSLQTCIDNQHPLTNLLINITRCPLPTWFQQYLQTQQHIHTTNPFVKNNSWPDIDYSYSKTSSWVHQYSELNIFSSTYNRDVNRIKTHENRAHIYLILTEQLQASHNKNILGEKFFQDVLSLYEHHLIEKETIVKYAHKQTIPILLSSLIDEPLKKMIQWDDAFAVYADIDPNITLGALFEHTLSFQEPTLYL